MVVRAPPSPPLQGGAVSSDTNHSSTDDSKTRRNREAVVVIKPSTQPKVPRKYAVWARSPPAATLIWYENRRGFKSFKVTRGVYGRLQDAGVFRDGRERDIILLVHGWHGVQSSATMFRKFLRYHQKLTPNTAVLLVDWEAQGSIHLVLGDAAHSATRLDIGFFLVGINENKTKLHCIGHSLGGHACGAICSHYKHLKGVLCERIVGLDPASAMFKHDSPWENVRSRRLSKNDAKYVAVLMTNRNFMGLAEGIGDEYLMTNIYAWYSEACPLLGKWWGRVCGTGFTGVHWCEDMDVGTMMNSAVIPHTKDSCSHMMAPITFMKLLDIFSSVSVWKLQFSEPKVIGYIPSVWSGYTTGKDYRYTTFFNPMTLWYSFMVESEFLTPYEILTVITEKGVNIETDWTSTFFHYLGSSFDVWLGVLDSFYDKKSVIRVRATGTVYMLRASKGQAFADNKSSFDKGMRFAPMTASAERMFKCKPHTHKRFNLWCEPSIPNSAWLPVYRSQLNVTSKYIAVPPVSGCLHYWSEFPDMLQTHYNMISVTVFTALNMTAYSDFDLFKIKIYNGNRGKNYTLATFWDVCNEFEDAGVEVHRFDRLQKVITLFFKESGTHTVHFVFQYEIKSTVVKVMERPKSSELPAHDAVSNVQEDSSATTRRRVAIADEPEGSGMEIPLASLGERGLSRRSVLETSTAGQTSSMWTTLTFETVTLSSGTSTVITHESTFESTSVVTPTVLEVSHFSASYSSPSDAAIVVLDHLQEDEEPAFTQSDIGETIAVVVGLLIFVVIVFYTLYVGYRKRKKQSEPTVIILEPGVTKGLLD